ncbi:MAG TPA: hypothetical protein VI793_02500 [Anaerolineales bacterium]|nr:hypothetical protein [Anaerolineales bacterium]
MIRKTAAALTTYYFIGWPGAGFGSEAIEAVTQWVREYAPRDHAWLSIEAGLLQVLAVYLSVWWRMRRKADRG